MATSVASSDVTDGPVLNFINKRLRALRKKLNRITQLEEGIAQGKPIKKEQEETLRSKPTIVASIDELEKLKQPLSVAVNEEITLAIERREADDKVKQTLDQQDEEDDDKTLFVIQDLLNLIYFGSLFDVKSQNDFNSIMLTRAHERECCLAYDYVTDDDGTDDMLGERDLDLISSIGSLLISRPVASNLSHQNALKRCIEQAKLWLEKSNQPIDVNSTVTYAGLREKLTKIMGSNYFTITPEMKAPVDVAAAAAGNYASFQVPAQVDESFVQYEQKEDQVVDYQASEVYDEQSSSVKELHKEEYDAEGYVETTAQTGSDKSHSEAGVEYREQQHGPRRQYQNQRGGGGRGGGRRGYSNGRGGRSGGRGGGGGQYQNGRNQYYDQPGGYYQRNNYYNNRGRGSRGGPVGNSYNHHHADAGVDVAES